MVITNARERKFLYFHLKDPIVDINVRVNVPDL